MKPMKKISNSIVTIKKKNLWTYLRGRFFIKARVRMVSIQSLFPFNYRLLPLLLHPLHFNHLSILNSVVSPQVLLWHQRLEHPCSKLLQSALSSFNNTIKIYVNNDICSQCTYCISAKMHKFPFPKHIMSSTFPLQLVHNDV